MRQVLSEPVLDCDVMTAVQPASSLTNVSDSAVGTQYWSRFGPFAYRYSVMSWPARRGRFVPWKWYLRTPSRYADRLSDVCTSMTVDGLSLAAVVVAPLV